MKKVSKILVLGVLLGVSSISMPLVSAAVDKTTQTPPKTVGSKLINVNQQSPIDRMICKMNPRFCY